MKKVILYILSIGVTIMLFGCQLHTLDHYQDTTPKVDLQEYFTGEIKAWGVIQDWRGRVTRRFDVTMVGEWSGDTGTLTEQFNFYDGEKQQRVWTIKRKENGHYEGTAHDILGVAEGQSKGNAVRWSYQMDLPVDGSTYRITFDDWMFLMNDGVLLNRSYLRKFGVTVAELTLFMQKQEKNPDEK